MATDAAEREWPLRQVLVAGMRPLLLVTASERDLQARAEALAEADLVACALHARLADDHVAALAEQLAKGRWDAALISARSLGDPRLMHAAQALAPRLLIVEGAHRVSRQSHRHDSAWRYAAAFAGTADCVLALADVANEAAREEIVTGLGLCDCRVALGALDRPARRIETRWMASQRDIDRHLLGLLSEAPQRAIIHVSQRVEAGRIAALVRDECGFDALDLTTLAPTEFGKALRRFREGGLRVIVTTGSLEAGADWPQVPLSVVVGLPPDLGTLHAQMSVATAADARAVLLHERGEQEPLERAAMRAACDAGHLLAFDEALAGGEELTLRELSVRTGLHPGEANLGVEALIQGGALRVLARGDEWLRAEASGTATTEVFHRWAQEADAIRRARLQSVAEVVSFAETRECKRRALAEALDYPLAPGRCECGVCRPREPVLSEVRVPGGYPLAAGDFRGWALGLYRRAGEETAGGTPGKMVEQLKYAGGGRQSEAAGRRLAGLMGRRVAQSRTYRDCDLIVPVPPSRPGGSPDPAAFLAREIGAATKLPVAQELIAARERVPQKELTSLSAKKSNIARAFAVAQPEEVDGQRILLVDDIFDSGATMAEAARTLLRAGAADVRLLAAVRTNFGWRGDV